jgi:hypothetical protein
MFTYVKNKKIDFFFMFLHRYGHDYYQWLVCAGIFLVLTIAAQLNMSFNPFLSVHKPEMGLLTGTFAVTTVIFVAIMLIWPARVWKKVLKVAYERQYDGLENRVDEKLNDLAEKLEKNNIGKDQAKELLVSLAYLLQALYPFDDFKAWFKPKEGKELEHHLKVLVQHGVSFDYHRDISEPSVIWREYITMSYTFGSKIVTLSQDLINI